MSDLDDMVDISSELVDIVVKRVQQVDVLWRVRTFENRDSYDLFVERSRMDILFFLAKEGIRRVS